MNLYAEVGLQYYDNISHSNISVFLVPLISLSKLVEYLEKVYDWLYCTLIYENSIYLP